MAIITISRQKGSLGTLIGQALKDEFGFNYVDRVSLEKQLVSKYGLPEQSVARYDEKKPAVWEVFSSEKDKYLHFLKTAMYEFAQKGDCIMIGRGGQVLFDGIPGVLRVSVVAPTETRIERVQKHFQYDARLAEQVVRHSDHDRAGFHRFFFHVNWEDYHLYDLVINTHAISVETGVQLVKGALQSLRSADKQGESESRIKDLCLSQEVITKISYAEKIPIHFIEVVSVSGVVTLKGSVMTSEDIARSEAVAKNVPGVKEVVNELYVMPLTYGMT